MAHSKQIHLALAEYGIDHDGNFPVADDYSNTAFRQLFDRKFQDERIFFVAGSAWHESLPEGQQKPDMDVGQAPDYLNGLEQGENHFAYVTGLNNGSKGNTPFIADGFTRTTGVYTDDPTKRGGVFEGEAAIVVRVDGSARMEKPGKDFRIYEHHNGERREIFSASYLGNSAKVLNPW